MDAAVFTAGSADTRRARRDPRQADASHLPSNLCYKVQLNRLRP